MDLKAKQIIEWYVLRWNVEVTFEESRRHLGVETQRQKVPANLADMTRILLAAGADVNATAGIYGASRTLTLLMTSDHPKQAGVREETVHVLEQAGAIS